MNKKAALPFWMILLMLGLVVALVGIFGFGDKLKDTTMNALEFFGLKAGGTFLPTTIDGLTEEQVPADAEDLLINAYVEGDSSYRIVRLTPEKGWKVMEVKDFWFDKKVDGLNKVSLEKIFAASEVQGKMVLNSVVYVRHESLDHKGWFHDQDSKDGGFTDGDTPLNPGEMKDKVLRYYYDLYK